MKEMIREQLFYVSINSYSVAFQVPTALKQFLLYGSDCFTSKVIFLKNTLYIWQATARFVLTKKRREKQVFATARP